LFILSKNLTQKPSYPSPSLLHNFITQHTITKGIENHIITKKNMAVPVIPALSGNLL